MAIAGHADCVAEFLKAFNVLSDNLLRVTLNFKNDSMVTIETERMVGKNDLEQATEIMTKRFKLVEVEGV